MLRVNEIYKSIQGEGIDSGRITVFLRLTGCNLKCIWCDTKYAYDEGKEKSIDEVFNEILKHNTRLICITGGEPLTQLTDLNLLLDRLVIAGYQISIETNGSLDITKLAFFDDPSIRINLDVKGPSSGMEKTNMLSNLNNLSDKDQVKFILQSPEDFELLKTVLNDYKSVLRDVNIILTPVGGTKLKNIADHILKDELFKQFTRLRVLPQIHKLIWAEKTRGV